MSQVCTPHISTLTSMPAPSVLGFFLFLFLESWMSVHLRGQKRVDPLCGNSLCLPNILALLRGVWTLPNPFLGPRGRAPKPNRLTWELLGSLWPHPCTPTPTPQGSSGSKRGSGSAQSLQVAVSWRSYDTSELNQLHGTTSR